MFGEIINYERSMDECTEKLSVHLLPANEMDCQHRTSRSLFHCEQDQSEGSLSSDYCGANCEVSEKTIGTACTFSDVSKDFSFSHTVVLIKAHEFL